MFWYLHLSLIVAVSIKIEDIFLYIVYLLVWDFVSPLLDICQVLLKSIDRRRHCLKIRSVQDWNSIMLTTILFYLLVLY